VIGASLDGPVSDFHPESFIFLKIQDALGPLDRGDRYEDPLAAALNACELGEVTGGGTQLGDERPDGTSTIEFCGIDVYAKDRDRAIALVRSELLALNAPVGSEIHYTSSGCKLQDVLSPSGWRCGEPRTELHPYFEC